MITAFLYDGPIYFTYYPNITLAFDDKLKIYKWNIPFVMVLLIIIY